MNMNFWTAIYFFCCFIWTASAALSRDEIVSRCKSVSREDLEPCLTKLINELQPRFAEGIPEFGLSPSEEIEMKSFNFSESSGSSFIVATFYDLKVKGFHEIKFTKLNVDYEAHTVSLEIEIPEMKINGRYIMNASFVLLPLQGDGTFWLNMRDVVANGHLIFGMKTINRDHFIAPKSADFDFNYGDIALRLNNLYKNNPVIKEAAEALLQNNARDIVDTLKPHLIHRIVDVIFEEGVAIGNTIPLKDWAGSEYLRKAFNIID